MSQRDDMSSNSKSDETTVDLLVYEIGFAEDADARIRDIAGGILRHFGGRMYISLSEVSMLVGISTKTMRRHAQLGHIRFSKIGHGKRKVRRAFTARDVAKFCLHVAGLETTRAVRFGRSRIGLSGRTIR